MTMPSLYRVGKVTRSTLALFTKTRCFSAPIAVGRGPSSDVRADLALDAEPAALKATLLAPSDVTEFAGDGGRLSPPSILAFENFGGQ